MVGTNGVLIDQGSNALRVGTSSVQVITAGSERMRIDSSGNVGIGTTSPDSKLEIRGYYSTGNYLIIRSTDEVQSWGSSGAFDRMRFIKIDCRRECTNIFQVGPGGVSIGDDYDPPAYGLQGTVGLTVQKNVGIGLTNPSKTLHVKGNTMSSNLSSFELNTDTTYGNLIISGTNSTTAGGITCSGAGGYFNTYSTTSAPDINDFLRSSFQAYFPTRDGNKINIGASIRLLDVNTEAGYPTALRGGAISFSTMNGLTGFFDVPVLERMRITPNGNVGIGITNPGVPLQVNGHIKSNSLTVYGTGTTFLDKPAGYTDIIAWFGPMNSSICAGVEVYLQKTSSGSTWTSTSVFLQYKVDATYLSYLQFTNSGISTSDLSVNGQLTVNGYVGIGTATPDHKLHVYGDTGNMLRLHRENAAYGANINIMFDHSNQSINSGKSYIQSYPHGNGTTSIRFFVSQTVGTTNVFQVNPDGGAWLSGTLEQSSDITLKKNIELLPHGLNTISKLNPVQYHFNQQNDTEHKHFGLIAQDVQDILPELVGVGGDGKLTLSYIELVPILVNGIREQQQMINDQQRSLAEQSQVINDLIARLSRVEAILSRVIA